MPVWSKEFLGIQATIECGFTLKRVRDMKEHTVNQISNKIKIFESIKFKHGFQDTLNPLCSCGLNIETPSNYSHHCPLFLTERSAIILLLSEQYKRNRLFNIKQK